MNKSRRDILALAAAVPAALVFGAAASAASPAVCYDPNTLPLSQKSRRRSLGYVDVSPEPAKKCGGCAFFTATQPGCGKCALFSGGPVNASGYCRSFAPKSK